MFPTLGGRIWREAFFDVWCLQIQMIAFCASSRKFMGMIWVRIVAAKLVRMRALSGNRVLLHFGRRNEISFFVSTSLGLPPLLTVALASISSVISGSSSYSCGAITCASTRFKSEPNLRADAVLFAFIGFPHAEDMAIRATRRVPNHHQVALSNSRKALLQSLLRQGINALAFCLRRNRKLFMQLR